MADIDLARVRQLARLARESGLSRLVSEEGGVRVSITVEPEIAAVAGAVVAAPADSPRRERPAAKAKRPPTPEELGLVAVTSPMIGIFYRAASPESPPYAEVGARIEEGDIVGIVEAMKVFNEVASETAGEVVEVVAQNQEAVSLGQVLMWLRP